MNDVYRCATQHLHATRYVPLSAAFYSRKGSQDSLQTTIHCSIRLSQKLRGHLQTNMSPPVQPFSKACNKCISTPLTIKAVHYKFGSLAFTQCHCNAELLQLSKLSQEYPVFRRLWYVSSYTTTQFDDSCCCGCTVQRCLQRCECDKHNQTHDKCRYMFFRRQRHAYDAHHDVTTIRITANSAIRQQNMRIYANETMSNGNLCCIPEQCVECLPLMRHL